MRECCSQERFGRHVYFGAGLRDEAEFFPGAGGKQRHCGEVLEVLIPGSHVGTVVIGR